MDLDSLDPVALARHERKEKGRLARLQNVLPSKVQAAPPTPAPTSSVGDSRTPKRFKYEEANALKQKAKQAVIGLLVGKGKVSALGVKRARAVKRRAQARRGDERLAVKQVTALRLSPCDRMTHRVTYMPFASTRTCPLRALVHALCEHTYMPFAHTRELPMQPPASTPTTPRRNPFAAAAPKSTYSPATQPTPPLSQTPHSVAKEPRRAAVKVGSRETTFILGMDSDSEDDAFWEKAKKTVKKTRDNATTPTTVTTTTTAASHPNTAATTTTDISDDDNDLSTFLPRKGGRGGQSTSTLDRTPLRAPAKRVKSKEEREGEEGLWDDEGWEEGGGKGRRSEPKEPHNMGKSVGGRKKGSSVPNATTSSSGEGNHRGGLHPDFGDEYRFGTVGPLVPYVLQADSGGGDYRTHAVPASLNRYLKDYQREGIRFLYSRVVGAGKGCILGDDMGLGKTIQVIGFLSAVWGKGGDGEDLRRVQEVMGEGETRREYIRAGEMKKMLGEGTLSPSQPTDSAVAPLAPRTPVMLIVPASVVDNWMSEFSKWGHFAVYKYTASTADECLDNARDGLAEAVVVPKSLFTMEKHYENLKEIDWKLIVVDEFHEYKNNRTQAFKNVADLTTYQCPRGRPVIGLTGTPMQNEHAELFYLADLVEKGVFGEKSEFGNEFEMPIKAGRKKDATKRVVDRAEKKSDSLRKILNKFYIARKKADELKDTLTDKDENVIFVEISQLQKELYQHVLSLPEFQMLSCADEPCDCGLNEPILTKMASIKGHKAKMAYLKANPFTKKKDCCHKIPIVPGTNANGGGGELHPDTTIWTKQHPGGECCKTCSGCMSLPCLSKLYKICSHPTLILAKQDPELMLPDEPNYEAAVHDMKFAKIAFPRRIFDQMGLNDHVRRQTGMMDDHEKLSGKLKALATLCKQFKRRGDRVLIFSQSTQTLDIINSWIKTQGLSFLRLDGTTSTSKRQGLVNQFQTDSKIFCFLISTRAGGIGLNLTSANRVIVYDVNWNPSHDEQAQDRAYRIGQTRDVQVYRLVARGTIEELMYMRQVYKVHLTKQTLQKREEGGGGGTLARLFNGVAKDNNQKGELFGLHNLLKYKDGSFMSEIWGAHEESEAAANDKRDQLGLDVVCQDRLAATLAAKADKQFESGDQTGLVSEDASVSLYDTLGVDTTALKPNQLAKRDVSHGVYDPAASMSQTEQDGGSPLHAAFTQASASQQASVPPRAYMQDFMSQQSSESQRDTLNLLKRTGGLESASSQRTSSQLLDSDITALNSQQEPLNRIAEEGGGAAGGGVVQGRPVGGPGRVQLMGAVNTDLEKPVVSSVYVPQYSKKVSEG